MPLSIDAQISYLLNNHNDIFNMKFSESLDCHDAYERMCFDDDDFLLFQVFYENCDDLRKAKNEMTNYVQSKGLENELVQIDNNNNITVADYSEINNQNHKDIVIKDLSIVVQYLTNISQEKFSTDHEKAIIEIAYETTKEPMSLGSEIKYYDLIPVFKKADRFGRWSIDPLFNHLKVYLMNNGSSFPDVWKCTKQDTNFKIIKEVAFLNKDSLLIKENIKEKKKLDVFLTNTLKYDKQEAFSISNLLSKFHISSIKDLQNLSDEGWRILFNQIPSRIDEIREEVEKIDLESSSSNSKQNDEFEQLNDWHRLERFLFHKANMKETLEKTGYLSLDALIKNFDHEEKVKTFNIESSLFEDIKNRFKSFTIPDEEKIKITRGMLFYGPPGTGKTTLMNLLIKIGGLTKIVEPLGSAELNRGLVGETEALLRDIFRRALYFPSILFCIAIDEIDSLVPKRESKNENSGKKDIVNQLLALIEGASNIKNVYLIGATNHLNKIDAAFARRMQDKFYIGYLSKKERLDLVKSINQDFKHKTDKIEFNNETEKLIEILTINFTGAAASELKTKIKIDYLLNRNNYALNKEKLTRYANEIIRSHNIKLGGFTIPDIISKSADCIDIQLKFLKDNLPNSLSSFTGRIVINLNEDIQSIQFELNNNSIHEISLNNKSIHFISEVIPLMLYLTIHLEINFIKLVDSNYTKLIGDGDRGLADQIIDLYDEFKDYNDGILMINADEIVGISETGTNDNGFDRSKLSTSLIDSAVMTKAFNYIFTKRETQLSENKYPKKWLIFATSSKFLNDSFKSLFKFPLNEKETNEKRIEQENKYKEHECVNCNKKYIEDENRVDSCSFHPKFLISKLSKGKIFKGLTKKEVFEIALSRLDEENILKEYVYFCCLKDYDSDGCTKDKHSNSEIKINQSVLNFEKKLWISRDLKTIFEIESNTNHWKLRQPYQDKPELLNLIEDRDDEITLSNKSCYYKLNSFCAKFKYNDQNEFSQLCDGQWKS